jgi:hypothetical protein
MFDNIVVGASDSPSGARAVRRAAELAGASGGTVHIVGAFRGGPGASWTGRTALSSSSRSRADRETSVLRLQVRFDHAPAGRGGKSSRLGSGVGPRYREIGRVLVRCGRGFDQITVDQ